MSNSYLSKQNLNMIAQAQQSIGISYKQGSIEIEDSIVMQSIDVIEGYVKGEVEITSTELPTLERMSKHLLHVLRGPLYHKVFALYQQLSKNISQVKKDKEKLANFDSVVSILNNKKQAQKLNMESLLLAKETIEADTSHTLKQKQRPMQQLQSYALRKYSEEKQNCRSDFEPYKKFVAAFGLFHQKTNKIINNKKANIKEKIEKLPQNKNACLNVIQQGKDAIVAKLKQCRHKIKRFYNKYEPLIALGALMAVAVGGWKALKSASSDNSQFSYRAVQHVIPNQEVSQHSEKTADFVKEQQKIATKKEVVKESTKVEADYYDTSLQIHLGSKEAVQDLYNKIDALAQNGKIKFLEGMDTKRYAHSFTMYNLILPNSAENKTIQNLLSGGDENPDLINQLVLNAKAKGEGIKPQNNSIKTSNFDKAAKDLQLQHLKNLQMQR